MKKIYNDSNFEEVYNLIDEAFNSKDGSIITFRKEKEDV